MCRAVLGFVSSLAIILGVVSCGELTSPAQPSVASVSGFGIIVTSNGGSLLNFAGCLTGASGAACFSSGSMRTSAVSGAPVTAPAAPLNLAASSSGNSVTLTWDAPGGGDPTTTYIIEAGSAPGLANLANFPTENGLTIFQASGVGAGTFYVRVRAVNAAGVSGPSNEATLVVGGAAPCSTPGAPIGLLLVFNSGGVVSFSWNAGTGSPSSYIIEAGSAPGFTNLANSDLGGTIPSLTATGVGAGTYYVRVRAKNACGTSSPSNEVIVAVSTSVPALLQPANDTVIPQSDPSAGCAFDARAGFGSRILFDWTDVPGVVGYQIFAIGPNATIPIIDKFVTASQLTFLNCAAYVVDFNLKGWQWRVRTLDSQGGLGSWSPVRTFNFGACRLPNGTSCG